MKKFLFSVCLTLSVSLAFSQNVFNPNDGITRYNSAANLGTPGKPNPAITGLQKWVSTATTGINGTWDASSYKAYYLNAGGNRMAFRIKFPSTYTTNPTKKYPIMVFLHGAGESACAGNNGIYNNEKQLLHGGDLFRSRVDNGSFDGFLVYPQLVVLSGTSCGASWSDFPIQNFNVTIAMLDSLAKYVRADIDRVLVTGLSGGGFGAWRIAANFPSRVSKIMPSAAIGNTTQKFEMVHIPIWFASGGNDTNPTPALATNMYNSIHDIGGDIRYTQFPGKGHGIWYDHWNMPGFVDEMNKMHKANPLVFFQRTEYCPTETITAKLGLSLGFYAYEWQRDNVTIATRTNTTNVIVPAQAQHVSAFTGNEITVKSYGTYRVRFKRSYTAAWSDWSVIPAVISPKATTQTPPITIVGSRSSVVPALDGNTTVPLTMPPGFLNYQWFRSSDNVQVASTQVFNAPAGVYKARYSEQFGCGTLFSPDFAVINANGNPKPGTPSGLSTSPLSQTAVQLNWTNGAGATGVEIYRGTQANGPYVFDTAITAGPTSYRDSNLVQNTTYYYVIRAISNTGASPKSNEATARTLTDVTPPTAPGSLRYRGSSQKTVSLAWNASTDNVGVVRYDIFANGAKVGSTTGISYTVNNLDSLTTYAMTVKAFDLANNASPASSQVSAYTHRQGLNFKYYTGTWSQLPNFSALSPNKQGITDTVNINNTGIKTTTTNYGFLWTGFIYIPVAGTYTFETHSGDGSKLYIDVPYSNNATPVVNNDFSHQPQTRTGTKTLTQGYHTIAITHFQNSGTSEMILRWSNNVGLATEQIPKNFFAYVNGTTGTIPAAPTGLSATALAYNKIRLNWTDASNNETGFEIVRSATSGGTYLPAGNVSANVATFTDSGLTELTQYFYKVRAVGAGGESAFTSAASATTPASPQTPIAPSGLEAEAGVNNSVVISWTDNSNNETSFKLYRSTDNVTFAQIAEPVANSNAYTDLTTAANTRYYYYIVGSNASGDGDPSNVVSFKAGNVGPAIGSLANLFVKTDATGMEDFTVSDDPTDVLTVSIVNKPSWLSVSHLSGNSYRITATPNIDNVGWFTITVLAQDNAGGSTSQNIIISVADKKTRSVYIDFGAAGKTGPAPWNKWEGVRGAGNTYVSLRDEQNVVTPFALTTVTAWASTAVIGHITGNNSGVAPDAVLDGGLWSAAASDQLRFSGLDQSKRYNISIIGSQNEGLPATVQYVSGSNSAVLDARYNTNRTANLNELVPDASGQIVFTGTRTGGSTISYLSAIVLEEYDPGVTVLNPEHLYVEPLDRTRTVLSWVDRTNNENASGGFELQRSTDSMFSANLVNIPLNANVTTYTNTGLAANTKYWYRVRAVSGGNASEWSNRAKVVTPNSIMSVNFNTTMPNAANPWNNLAANGDAGITMNNLKDQNNAATSVGLQFISGFNGEFTAGVNTGNNSGIVPDNVLASDIWLDNSQLAQIKLTGLNLSRRYRIGFVGSSSLNGWFRGDYTAKYTIGGRSVYLNSWMNSTKVVYISDVVPNGNGEVILNFSTSASAQWGFNSGIIIQDYTDSQGGFMSNSVLDPGGSFADSANRRIITEAKAYPNPFRELINIDFFNESAGNKITAEVYDLNGRLINRKYYDGLPAGYSTLRLDQFHTSQRNGVFIVAIKVNGKVVQTAKMIRK